MYIHNTDKKITMFTLVIGKLRYLKSNTCTVIVMYFIVMTDNLSLQNRQKTYFS